MIETIMNDVLSLENIQYTWDQIANSFDKTRKHPWRQCIDFLGTLSRNDIVGDFGCGNGRHTIEIANHCKQVIAIDLSKKLLKILKQKIKTSHTIEIIHANLINVPLKDNCLDSVFYIASLHNIPKKKQRKKSLKELYRVLKPNGSALISVWSINQDKYYEVYKNFKSININTDSIEKGDVFIYWNQDNLHVPRFYHFYDRNEIQNELLETGFKIHSFKEEMIASRTSPDNYFITVVK
jgi:ubiquinone/menaquinone biosynthesis C-methylase UbiE